MDFFVKNTVQQWMWIYARSRGVLCQCPVNISLEIETAGESDRHPAQHRYPWCPSLELFTRTFFLIPPSSEMNYLPLFIYIHTPKSQYLSIKARNLCLSVCVLQISLQIRIRLTWDFQHGCCVVQGCAISHLFGLNKLFQKCFTNSTSIVHRSHHSHVRTRANHCRARLHDTP